MLGHEWRSQVIVCFITSTDPTKVLKERNQESVTEQRGKKPKQKGANNVAYHKISYLTTDEFESVPK